MHARPLVVLFMAFAALAGVGCGSERTDGAEPSADSRVNPDGDLPLVFELAAAPDRPGDMLLSTNKGLFRVAAGKATPQTARVQTEEGTSPIGRTMAFTALDAQTLMGSGHPDDTSVLPQEMGLLRSTDGGRTWTSVARMGDADLHMLEARHDRLYAWDAVLGAVLVSEDQGKTFSEGITPPGLIVDMAVDPRDADNIVIAGETAIYRSEDAGKTWRPLTSASDARLAWPETGPLIRADSDGSVHQSTDGGERWDSVGSVEDQPQDFHVSDDGAVHLALADGSVWRSTDGGRTWENELPA